VAPPYSARISAIYLLLFGEIWLGSVCHVNEAEFTDGGWKLQSYCNPFVDQSSRHFEAM